MKLPIIPLMNEGLLIIEHLGIANHKNYLFGLQCQGVLLSIIPHSLMELWVISLSMSMSFIFSDFFIFHRKLKTKHLMLLIITGEVILLLSAFIEGQLDEYLLRKVLNIG